MHLKKFVKYSITVVNNAIGIIWHYLYFQAFDFFFSHCNWSWIQSPLSLSSISAKFSYISPSFPYLEFLFGFSHIILIKHLQVFPIIFGRHPNVFSWPALCLVPVYLVSPSSTPLYSLCMDLREFSLCSLSTGRGHSLIFTQLVPSPDSGLRSFLFSERPYYYLSWFCNSIILPFIYVLFLLIEIINLRK